MQIEAKVHVLFQIGSNDLLTANSAECINEKEYMEELISITKSKLIDTTVCVSELIRRSLGNQEPTYRPTYNRTGALR